MFEWNSNLEIGVAKIDAQHRELVGMLAKLFEAMHDGAGASVLDDILAQLEDYAREHFAVEEALMEQHGYRDRDTHLAAHKVFHRKVATLKEQFEQNGQGALSIQVVLFLRNWLTDHIANVDQALGDFLNQEENPT